MHRSVATAVACLSLTGCAGCTREPVGAEQPKNEAFVLVDLSETWHNPSYAARNERTLTEIGAGLSVAADSLEPPYLIQYRVIGANSYEREPACEAEYMPSLVAGTEGDTGRVTRPNKLRALLAACTQVILAKPPETRTEITAALRSVADQPTAPRAVRKIIVASDFLEESFGGVDLSKTAFQGAEVLLLYRPLADDQLRPADATDRIEAWRGRLQRAGAKVQVMPDTALRRSQIVTFVTHKE